MAEDLLPALFLTGFGGFLAGLAFGLATRNVRQVRKPEGLE
ncbi:hypothetical protein [Albimonas pacifica]|uniref:Uncharacterized protein n=1 Tax=Albimonas pacifica TaxID=1114924 RepID=A0A1I3JIH0_9RHOB|nr:hypothetical protein [Albimonas pacifica]SFI60047.1 hypothetical protein SAMN05216258_10822 [Albimonas pacifica]